MTHYVLFQYTPGAPLDDIEAWAKDAFAQLTDALDCINSAQVYRNCVERDGNAELMIKLDLTGKDALGVYLNHPLHKAFVEKTTPYVSHRTSFDCM
jgi:hypothetical protein